MNRSMCPPGARYQRTSKEPTAYRMLWTCCHGVVSSSSPPSRNTGQVMLRRFTVLPATFSSPLNISFLSTMHEAWPASGGNSSVGTTSSSPTLKSRSSANGEASTTLLRLCHCGSLRLVVSWPHSAVSTGTAMALAMTRALSVVAPDIAPVNFLNIYFISESLVTPPADASSGPPPDDCSFGHRDHLLHLTVRSGPDCGGTPGSAR